MTEPVNDNLLLDKEAGQEQTTQETKWYSDAYKDVVAKKGWKTGDDALKSYTELEKSFGGRVKLPSPESSAEEIRAFYQKTGCPENPDGYELKDLPADIARNEDAEKAVRQIAYDFGVSKQAFESIVKGYYEKLATDMQKSREDGERALRQELGDKYDAELNIARSFCKTCSNEFKDLLEKTGLGNNPVFIKEFINKGKQTMGDTLIRGHQEGNKEESYIPQYKDSPEMYKSGEDDESKKARAFFEAKGFKY